MGKSTRTRFRERVLRRTLAVWCGVLLTTGAGRAQAGSAGEVTATQPTMDALRQMIAKGHAEEALEKLNVLAAQRPAAAGVFRTQGMALYAEGKLGPASEAFAAAVTQDSSDREAALMQGITLFRLGRPGAAIPLLEAARQPALPGAVTSDASKAPVDPLYVLALCYVETRRYDDARRTFAAQFGFAPDGPAAYLLAARMLIRREYVPVAEQFARKALDLQPNLPLAHRLLGEVALAGGHLEEAVTELERERELNPLEPSLYDRLGDAYTRQGNLDRAKASLQEAVLLDPNSTGPFIQLGKVLLKQGDAVTAAGYLERARGMDTQNFMTHSLLGQAYRQMGRAEDARREVETAQKLQAVSAPKLDSK